MIDNVKWCLGLILRLVAFVALAYCITSIFTFVLKVFGLPIEFK